MQYEIGDDETLETGSGLNMTEIERDVFVFFFGIKADHTYVLDRELWLFENSLLALIKLEEFDCSNGKNFQFVSI